jgi:hypothetical protein
MRKRRNPTNSRNRKKYEFTIFRKRIIILSILLKDFFLRIKIVTPNTIKPRLIKYTGNSKRNAPNSAELPESLVSKLHKTTRSILKSKEIEISTAISFFTRVGFTFIFSNLI